MSRIENELRSIVDAFVSDLSELVRRQAIEAVDDLLDQRAAGRPRAATALAAAPARAGAPRARAARAGSLPLGRPAAPARGDRQPGEKRTPQELASLVERLFDFIQSSPGQGVEQIGRALATPTKDLTLPLRKLVNGKRVTTKGHKRATRYFPR